LNINLFNEEEELTRKYIENQDIFSNVSLKYEQVINNIKKLCGKIQEKSINSEDNSAININSDNSIIQHSQVNNYNEINNEDNYINLYNDCLIESEKTIDILFLCQSKQKFVNMLKEKEIEDNLKKGKKISKSSDKNILKNNNLNRSKKISEMEEMEFVNDDKIEENEAKIQQQIYNQYMNSQKRKIELFIKNEKEKR
jgi:hypothetical protein